MFSLRPVPLYTGQYGRMVKENHPLIPIIMWLSGKHIKYMNYMQHFQIHSIHLKTTEETLLPCKLFDIKSVIKINLISLGIPFYLRAK